jgi:4-hydroxybenzoyl-CoA reductase subunit beta
MERLSDLRLCRPATAAEAAQLLASPGARALAGGTDLIVNLRHGVEKPRILVDLGALTEIGQLRWKDAALEIGAGVTLAHLARDARVRQMFPVLVQAAESVAAPGHRSAGTVGGNLCLDTRCVYYNQSEDWRRSNGYCLKRNGDVCHVAPQGKRCHAAFSGDMAPAFLVLESQLEITGPTGTRTVPLHTLYQDDGARHLALAPGEFVAAVHVPLPAPGTRAAYRKNRARGAIDFPLAGVAVALATDGGKVSALRVALTGTNSHPLLLEGTGEFLGQPLTDAALTRLGKLVQKQVSPVRTTLTAPNYRRQVASVLAQRLVRELLEK